MLQGLLIQEEFKVGRLHVATLMKRMGIEALYRRPNTSKPAPGHKIYTCLVRKLAFTRPNQVWAMDLTYIPMARGFTYLAAAEWVHPAGAVLGGCRSRWGGGRGRTGTPEIFNTHSNSASNSFPPPQPAPCSGGPLAAKLIPQGVPGLLTQTLIDQARPCLSRNPSVACEHRAERFPPQWCL